MTKDDINSRFNSFYDIQLGAIEAAVKQLLHAIGTQPVFMVDNDDIAYIASLVENHVLDEIGAKTCVPYYGDDGEPCYRKKECQYPNCMFRVWDKKNEGSTII